MANGIFIGIPRTALTFVNRFAAVTDAGLVDLTFASVLPRVLEANAKSKTTPESIAGVPLVLTFVNEPAATGYECQNRDTSRRLGANVGRAVRKRKRRFHKFVCGRPWDQRIS